MFGEWITEEILCALPHRQYVFTVPKMLRPHFRFDRKLLGKLSQCAYQSLKEFYRKTLNTNEAVPGVDDFCSKFSVTMLVLRSLPSSNGQESS